MDPFFTPVEAQQQHNLRQPHDLVPSQLADSYYPYTSYSSAAAAAASHHHPPPPGTAPHAPFPASRRDSSPMSPELHYPQQEPGMNPAAVATMGMQVPGMTYPFPVHLQSEAASVRPALGGRLQYRGGGRRGRELSRGRGGGRGNLRQHHPRPEDGAPFHGRGRGRMGRAGGKRPCLPVPDTQSTSAPAAAVESSSTSAAGQEPTVTQPTIPAPLRLPLFPNAWCDICRVECSSNEILEVHKNGKRHKRTVKRLEEIEAQQKCMAELTEKLIPIHHIVLGIEGNQAALEDTPNKISAALKIMLSTDMDNNSTNSEQESMTVDKQPIFSMEETATEVPTAVALSSMEPHGSSMGGSYNEEGGLKRNMSKSIKGGKRMKYSEQTRGEFPKGRSIICTLCKATCNTLAMFEGHLAGKKHLSQMKRFQRPGMVYGPLIVYIPPNQPSSGTMPVVDPLFYGLTSHDMVNQEVCEYNCLNVKSSEHQQGVQAGKPSDEFPDPQVEQGPKHQESEVLATAIQEGSTMNPEGQNAEPELEDNGLPLASNTASMEAGVVSTIQDGVSCSELGVTFADSMVLPGLDGKVIASVNNEELKNRVFSL